MAEKPSSKPNWIPSDDVNKITEPTTSKKNTGWLALEKPPFQFFNWFYNTISKWIHYFAGEAQYNIIVGGDSDERDYDTMAAYIADSPTAGDRVLIKEDEVLTATLIIPGSIEIKMIKGKKFTLTTNFSPIIQIGSNVKIIGELAIINSNTGTISRGFSLNNDNIHADNLIIQNLSTGTITNALYILAGAESIYAQGRAINSGGGSITNDLTDASGNDKNNVIVRGDSGISRSRGAKKFDILDVTQIKLKKGSDIASASGINIPDDGNYFDITGTTAITNIGSKGIGFVARLHFDASLTLTHHATDLVLPSGANIQTATGDEATFVEYASADWRCTNYTRADGTALIRNSNTIVQQVNTQTGAVATGTNIFPPDDTIPQNTEGDEYMTLAITPKSSSNKLRIEVVFIGAHSNTATDLEVALFQDSTVNAIAAAWGGREATTNSLGQVVLIYEMTAGTTSSTTFKVRGGSTTAGTLTFNGWSGARKLGGVLASSITITEYKA